MYKLYLVAGKKDPKPGSLPSRKGQTFLCSKGVSRSCLKLTGNMPCKEDQPLPGTNLPTLPVPKSGKDCGHSNGPNGGPDTLLNTAHAFRHARVLQTPLGVGSRCSAK